MAFIFVQFPQSDYTVAENAMCNEEFLPNIIFM